MYFLGKNIRFLRKEKNLTRAKLAELLEVNPRTVTYYETDVNEPNINKLVALSEIFEVLIDDLIKKDMSDN